MLKIGDIVSRKKYGNDILFKIDKIIGNKVYLKGIDIRLYADSSVEDLVLCGIPKKKEKLEKIRQLNTDLYFYIPPVIVHLDGDSSYLEKCKEYYNNQNLKVYGYSFSEDEMYKHVEKLIKNHNPGILVMTGHDAHYKSRKDGEEYKNSKHYISAVREARKLVKNHENLIIIAGACQSDYESLIKAGATYASSPKNVNIHALDPAIIASSIALTDSCNMVNIEEVLSKTHYKEEGMGGIITNGKMIVGYPRKGE